MRTVRFLATGALLLLISVIRAAPVVAGPGDQLTWAVGASIAPTWFDPAETSGIITPWIVLLALHDGLVRSIAGNAKALSLAESWSVSSDGLLYEFVLRKGTRFHNGEAVTAEGVKFSFDRYRGAAPQTLNAPLPPVAAP